MSKSLKKLIDINGLREFKNKLVGVGSAYVQTGAVDQTIAGTKTFSKPIAGSVTGSSGSCTGNAATATKATQDAAGNTITTTYATKAENNTKANNSEVVHKSGDETIAGTKTFSKPIVGSVTGSSGNGVDSQGENWIRFRNGIQICWARIQCETSGSSTWTYGASFSSTPIVTVCDNGFDTRTVYLTRAGNIRTTSCLIVMVHENDGSYAPGYAQCIAIGKWK